jgi:hypothetical protein
MKRWWTRWTGPAGADGKVTLRAFYGTHRVTVNGKEILVDLRKADGTKRVAVE